MKKQTPYRHAKPRRKDKTFIFWARRQWMLLIFTLTIAILLWRAIFLQIMHKDFLQAQGEVRHLRTIELIPPRGSLFDARGEPLAVSTPVDSVWVHPKQFKTAQPQWPQLAALLNMSTAQFDKILEKRWQREFVYLKRHIFPNIAEKIEALQLPGVFLQREYHRYYPTGEVTSQVLGFTNIDDQGQEGLELALDLELRGKPGAKRVVQDKHGQAIAEVGYLSPPQAGRDIYLSIDRRLQYIAYRSLKTTVQTHRAKAGSAVIMRVDTGEILAMVNQPAQNPNDWQKRDGGKYRNRIVTDVFEPGSTMKPFTIAAALESGKFTAETLVDTRPGFLQLGQYTIRDSRNYGRIDLATIIKKSSNVGASRISAALPKAHFWKILTKFGFGQLSGSGFPGEVTGKLSHFLEWQTIEQTTLGFGYGLNVTLLQLARAYAVLGNHGLRPAVRFLPIKSNKMILQTQETQQQVIHPHTAKMVLQMLEAVVAADGTGAQAQIPGFRIAGKTGTVHKPSPQGGYAENAYLSLFVGLVPADKPRLVMAVMIDEPQDNYYGGKVAAPLFATVMADTLRLLGIAPSLSIQ